MAWTDPRTWVTDELVTAVMMNTHVRDNFNSLPHLIVRKTADETVNNSATLQPDDQLILPVGANEIWKATWYLLWSSSTTADMKINWTFPSGATVSYLWVWMNAAGTLLGQHQTTSTSPTTSTELHGFGTEVVGPLAIEMLYAGGASAGNVTLQWAQQAAEVSNTIMKANSTIWAAKLV